jgi:hypothetical protein
MTDPTTAVWQDLDNYLHHFHTPVLTFRDPDGYPFSLRCRPRHDRQSGLMVVPLPDGTPAVEGPAWLLWHSHDEQAADLKALAVQGRLTRADSEWHFHPERVRPGPGLAPGGWEPILASMHRETERFLESKGLSPPEIQWGKLAEIARHVADTHRRS